MKARNVAVLSLFLIPAPLAAQHVAVPDSGCVRRVPEAEAGRISQADLAVLQHCGPRGRHALALLIRAAAFETDTTYLNRLAAVSQSPSEEVFGAASDVARRAEAGGAARITALRIMLSQVYGPGAALAFGSFPPPTNDECAVRFLSGPRLSDKDPAQRTRTTRLRSISEQIAVDASTPPLVRSAARCIRNVFHPRIDRPVQLPVLVLVHDCGQRYRIVNEGDIEVTLRWEATASADSGFVTARPGETRFMLPSRSAVRLRFRDAIVAEASPGPTECPRPNLPRANTSPDANSQPDPARTAERSSHRSACVLDSSVLATSARTFFRRVAVGADDPRWTNVRQQLRITVVLDSSAVTLVTDESVCETALTAYGRHLPRLEKHRAVVVVIDTLRAVFLDLYRYEEGGPIRTGVTPILIMNADFTRVIDTIWQ